MINIQWIHVLHVCHKFNITIRQCLSFSPLSSNFVDNPLSIERPGIGGILLFMFLEGFVYFTLTLLIQVHHAIASYIILCTMIDI